MTGPQQPRSMSLRTGISIALVAATLGWHASAIAFTMSATPAEVSALPPYCRARLAGSPGFSVQGGYEWPSASEIAVWQQTLGTAFISVHHMCGGRIWLERALRGTHPLGRQYSLDQALYETKFTYERVPVELPFFATVSTQLGLVHRARKEYEAAASVFDRAMVAHPKQTETYQATALTLQDQGRLQEARDVLERGDTATEGQSADLHYMLGLLLIKMKDLDEAERHARLAYSLGYPLPGLRRKLSELGRPLD